MPTEETPQRLPTLPELTEGITPLEDGVFRLAPGYYWITLTNDPNHWYRDALRNESMLGNLSIVKISSGLPGQFVHPSLIDLPEAVFRTFIHPDLIELLLPEPARGGQWILFKVHRPLDWRMPYLGIYAWGPYRATREAQTIPGDVGQEYTPPIEWWSPAEWDVPKFGAAVPWLLFAGALGTAVYLAKKR